MRSFVLIACVATLAVLAHGLTEEQRNRVKQVHSECQADPATHVEEEILQKAYRGENVEGTKVGVHILCMSKKIGFQKENGEVDKAVLKKRLSVFITDEAKVNQGVEKCGVQKSTAEETAASILKCFADQTGHVLHNHAHHHH